MKRILLILMIVLWDVSIASTSYSALVTGQFSGIITAVEDEQGILSGTGITADTSTFTGNFSYDTSTPPYHSATSSFANQALYHEVICI